jgi:LuxR family transcriptional regulator
MQRFGAVRQACCARSADNDASRALARNIIMATMPRKLARAAKRPRVASAWRELAIDRLTAPAASVDEVFQRLAELTRALGFEFCSVGIRAPTMDSAPREVWSTTYPSQWSTRYLGNNYLAIDPVIQHARRRAMPFVWSGTSFEGPRPFWDEARACGVRHGWTLAIHGRHGETGLVSLARSADPVSRAELADVDAKLVWLCHLSHEAISARFVREVWPAAPALSVRERDVLRWTAMGKTCEEIGAILKITTRTVTFHVTSLVAKLDAVNKTHAVAKAAMLGLL